MKFIHLILLVSAIMLGFYSGDVLRYFAAPQSPIDMAQYCMLSTKPCSQNGVSIRLEHDRAKPLVPSQIEVNWPDASHDSLLLSLEGMEMEMGVAKYSLNKQPNGLFIGTVLLPVCTQDSMTWIGTISNGSEQVYTAIRMER